MLYALLGVVAGAAAVLSFAALRDLALLCGFGPRLAWLLPVVVDAGAAAGSLVWLGGNVGSAARRFARALALGLLALSVGANALGHGLAAFSVAPAWWVVVAVSAVAPAVLGAVVHLAVLVGRAAEPAPDVVATGELAPSEHLEPLDTDASNGWLTDEPVDGTEGGGSGPDDRAAELIAAGAGRRRLSRELGLTEYEARRLLERTRTGATPADVVNGATVGGPR